MQQMEQQSQEMLIPLPPLAENNHSILALPDNGLASSVEFLDNESKNCQNPSEQAQIVDITYPDLEPTLQPFWKTAPVADLIEKLQTCYFQNLLTINQIVELLQHHKFEATVNKFIREHPHCVEKQQILCLIPEMEITLNANTNLLFQCVSTYWFTIKMKFRGYTKQMTFTKYGKILDMHRVIYNTLNISTPLTSLDTIEQILNFFEKYSDILEYYHEARDNVIRSVIANIQVLSALFSIGHAPELEKMQILRVAKTNLHGDYTTYTIEYSYPDQSKINYYSVNATFHLDKNFKSVPSLDAIRQAENLKKQQEAEERRKVLELAEAKKALEEAKRRIEQKNLETCQSRIPINNEGSTAVVGSTRVVNPMANPRSIVDTVRYNHASEQSTFGTKLNRFIQSDIAAGLALILPIATNVVLLMAVLGR